jgi:two-component system response regulator (stage 0 sporulation protein F)
MSEQKQLKLLVVDDEPGIVDFTQKIYQKRGFLTFGATDGIAAVEIFEKERPEINLIDIHMPYSPIDGIEVLRRIKALEKEANCIMVTRIHQEKEIEEARKLGALHYLTKPFEIEELDKCIADIAAKYKQKAKDDGQAST